MLAHALHKIWAYFISGKPSMFSLNTHPGLQQSPLCPEASSFCSCSFPGSWMGKWIGAWQLLGWRWLSVSYGLAGHFCSLSAQPSSAPLCFPVPCSMPPPSHFNGMCPMGHHSWSLTLLFIQFGDLPTEIPICKNSVMFWLIFLAVSSETYVISALNLFQGLAAPCPLQS